MTDIEQKALALVNEVRRERGLPSFELYDRTFYTEEALCRAIEKHEAFRQEVSDAVEAAKRVYGGHREAFDQLDRFIIAKPDPLVEAVGDALEAQGMGRPKHTTPELTEHLLAAIEARGGRIVWEGE